MKKKSVTKEQVKKEFNLYYTQKRNAEIKSKIKQNKKKAANKVNNKAFFNDNTIEPSEAEKIIINFLTEMEIEFFREVSFELCKNPKTNAYFRFDFYIPNLNLIIEYDGAHHQEEYFKYADKMKNHFCRQNRIKLLRLDKTNYYNMKESILPYLKVHK